MLLESFRRAPFRHPCGREYSWMVTETRRPSVLQFGVAVCISGRGGWQDDCHRTLDAPLHCRIGSILGAIFLIFPIHTGPPVSLFFPCIPRMASPIPRAHRERLTRGALTATTVEGKFFGQKFVVEWTRCRCRGVSKQLPCSWMGVLPNP